MFQWQLYWKGWYRLPWYSWSIEFYNGMAYVANYGGIGPFQCQWMSGYASVPEPWQ